MKSYILFLGLFTAACSTNSPPKPPPQTIKKEIIAEPELNYVRKGCNKPPLKKFLYPSYFVKKMLPYYICENKLAGTGYYDNFMAMFDSTAVGSKTGGKFELKHEGKQWIIERAYKSSGNDWTKTFSLFYFDGNYAIFKRIDRFILLVDVRLHLIMAFTPSYMLKPEYLTTGQQPHFFNLYFLDENLYPYASLDCNTVYQKKQQQEFDGLALSTYDYSQAALYQQHLNYKIQKKLPQISYTDFIEFNNIVKNKIIKIESSEKLSAPDEETIYKNVPLWTF